MMTRSGDVRLATVTDAQTASLVTGDVLLRETVTGYEPVTVQRVRDGVAFDDSLPPQPYAVPVIEAVNPRGRTLVYGAADLVQVVAHGQPPRVIVEPPAPVERTDSMIWVDDYGSNGPSGMRHRCYFNGRADELLGVGPAFGAHT